MNLDKPLLMLVTSASQMGQGQQTGLWLEEFAVPYGIFQDHKIPLVVASLRGGKVPVDPRSVPDDEQKEQWREALGELESTRPLEEIWEDGFAAVFVPGGHGAMFDMPDNPLVAGVLERTWAQGGVVSAVCHGPAALVGARDENGLPLVRERKVSCFTNEEEQQMGLEEVVPFLLESRLRELGADIHNRARFEAQVSIDGRLITGQNPASSRVSAEAVVKAVRSE